MEVASTQASSVIPEVRFNEVELLMVTREFVPLKSRASPYLPAVDHVALVVVPLLLFPEVSCSVVPEPSSKL